METSRQTITVDALGHNYGSVVTAPTCTAQGYTTHTCSTCGDSYVDDYTPVIAHSFSEWARVTNPTCTTEGLDERLCACGERETRPVDMLAHSYESVVTAPKCTVDGYTTYTCVCGDSYVSDRVAATGHSYGEYVVTQPATCTAMGEETQTCLAEGCGATQTRKINMIAHNYVGVVTAPTCVKAGYTTYTCSACSDNYKGDEVAATGEHSYEEGSCTVCGGADPDYVPPHVHNYKSEVVTDATCTTAGEEKLTCECGHSYNKVTAPLGHDTDNDLLKAVSPTYTSTGLTAGKQCSRCGLVLESQRLVDKLLNSNMVYFKPNTNWKSSNAWFMVYTWGSAGTYWIKLNDINNDGIYEAQLPAGNTDVIFCRMNSAATAGGDWGNVWNQTNDLTLAATSTSRLYTVSEGAWSKGNGAWSAHTPTFTYTLAGCLIENNKEKDSTIFGTAWNVTNTANDLTYDATINAWVKTYSNVTAGKYQFKVVYNHAWTINFPTNNYEFTVDADNTTVVIAYYPAAAQLHVYQVAEGAVVTYAVRSTPDNIAPSCVAAGRVKFNCNCGQCEGFFSMIPALEHEMKNVDAKDSTCSVAGYKAYEECVNCGYNPQYVELSTLDHTGGTATCDEQAKCEACGTSYGQLAEHALVDVEEKAKTCTEDGYNAHIACENCEYTEGKEVYVAGHDWIHVDAKDPTCATPGWSEFDYCQVETCGVTTEHEEYSALGHEEETIPAVAATCTKTGLTEGKKCTRCGNTTVEQEVVDLLDHQIVEVNAQASTCTTQGWKAYEYCSVCDYTTKVALALDANNHSYGTTACTECGKLAFEIITFDDKSKRTEFSTTKQVWEENGIIVTNLKTADSSNVADYSQPIRFYKNSKITISYPGITKIVFHFDSTEYADLPTIGGASIADNGSKIVTVIFDNAIDEFTFVASVNQLRVNSIEVHFGKPCPHNEMTSKVVLPKCTEDGYTEYTCECGYSYKSDITSATGHTPGTAATCTTQAVCATCKQSYGDVLGHTTQSGTCSRCNEEIGGTSSATPVTLATFNLGANGSASHYDGNSSSKTSYSETVNGLTLNITNGSYMYTGARDAKGNSCIKFGSSKNAGSCTITVPANVTKVIIYVAQYKANTAKITVNGTTYTITTASNNGAYTAVEIDTTTNKTVTFTVSSGLRAMVNTIEFIGTAQ